MNEHFDLAKDNLYNLPIVLSIADYKECCELAVRDFRKNNAAVSMYVMGGKWCPGISDLDIVAVYKNGTKPKPLKSPWSLSEKAKFIFTHRHLSFDEKSFTDFYYIYPKSTSNLRLLWGKDIILKSPEEELSEKENKFLLSFIVFDVLVNKLLLFPRRARDSKIDVRQMIGELYSLFYTFEILKNITRQEIGTEFIVRIKNLRKNWFIRDFSENLKELSYLYEAGANLVLETVTVLNEFLVSQEIWGYDGIVFRNKKYHIAFSKNWNKEKFFATFHNGHVNITVPVIKKNIENFKLLLPQSFSYFFLAYANVDGGFSERVKNALNKIERILFDSRGIKRHVAAVNNVFEASQKSNGLYKMPFSYGFTTKKRNFLINKLMEISVSSIRLFK